ncbi:hypothetical protein cypCar_00046667, partial [Cyprinus carpio]
LVITSRNTKTPFVVSLAAAESQGSRLIYEETREGAEVFLENVIARRHYTMHAKEKDPPPPWTLCTAQNDRDAPCDGHHELFRSTTSSSASPVKRLVSLYYNKRSPSLPRDPDRRRLLLPRELANTPCLRAPKAVTKYTSSK